MAKVIKFLTYPLKKDTFCFYFFFFENYITASASPREVKFQMGFKISVCKIFFSMHI